MKLTRVQFARKLNKMDDKMANKQILALFVP